mmetsp:Transcript_57122/g.121421  ORF Transcript_57122/g.121421 Transcript_57122/m.121421 type:complete len:212 (+) Transcript_57122:281-916(+)
MKSVQSLFGLPAFREMLFRSCCSPAGALSARGTHFLPVPLGVSQFEPEVAPNPGDKPPAPLMVLPDFLRVLSAAKLNCNRLLLAVPAFPRPPNFMGEREPPAGDCNRTVPFPGLGSVRPKSEILPPAKLLVIVNELAERLLGPNEGMVLLLVMDLDVLAKFNGFFRVGLASSGEMMRPSASSLSYSRSFLSSLPSISSGPRRRAVTRIPPK